MEALARALGRLPGPWRASELLLAPLSGTQDVQRLLRHGRAFSSVAAEPAAAGGAGASSSSSSGGGPASSEQQPPQQQQQQQREQHQQPAAVTGSTASPGSSTSNAGAAAGSAAAAASSAAAAGPSTVSSAEAAKFAALAGQWWDPAGPFAPLHAMNPVRCRFLRAALCAAFGRDAAGTAPLAGLRLLDVGCGGGVLAESLARMGAHVTGIDVNEGGIATAVAHAARDPDLAGRLEYRTAAAEQLVQEGATFDAVIASEVIEHVASLPAFCAALDALTRPGGGVAISTLNRTPRSYALAILAAEHLLRWVPPGTHEWERFITPEELAMQMEESTGAQGAGAGGGGPANRAPLHLQLLAGMEYNPITGGWSLGRDTAVNYIAFFAKPAAGSGAAAAAPQ